MPGKLGNRIKNDINTVFQPLDIDDSPQYMIVKLENAPEEYKQEELITKIRSSYDLDPGFEKISNDGGLYIYKMFLLKGKKTYSGVKEIYLFWKEKKAEIPKETVLRPEEKIDKTEKKIVKAKKKEYEQKKESTREIEPKIKQEKEKNVTIDQDVLTKGKERPEDEDYARITIVLDDVGYNYQSTYDFLDLEFPVTFSIIPDMPESGKFYKLIRKRNFDFLLHIPMEPEKGAKYVEKNAILSGMSNEQIKKRIDEFISEYEGTIGANNHMGSKVVTDKRIMNSVISELSKNNLFWLDSMTNLNSTAREITEQNNSRYYKRDVFLDNVDNPDAIRESMNKLVDEAKKNGSAIGIGHVQSKNLSVVLREFYQNRKDLKIKFVNLRDL